MTQQLLDGPSVIGEYDAQGARKAFYLQNLQRIDEFFSATNLGNGQTNKCWPIVDALGSVLSLVDRHALVYSTTSYLVFGERVERVGFSPVRFGFAGRETDDRTGLQFSRSRNLHIGWATWMSPDVLTRHGPPVDWPIEWPIQSRSIGEEVNPYQYLRLSPTNVVDPYGTAGVFAILYLVVMVALMSTMFEYVFPLTIDAVYTIAAQNGYNATLGLRSEFMCRAREADLRLDLFSPLTDSFWSRLPEITLAATRATVAVRDYAPSSPNLGTALPTLNLILINRAAVTQAPWTSYPMLLFILYLAELQHIAGGKTDGWSDINKELDDLIEFFGLGPRPPISHGGGV